MLQHYNTDWYKDSYDMVELAKIDGFMVILIGLNNLKEKIDRFSKRNLSVYAYLQSFVDKMYTEGRPFQEGVIEDMDYYDSISQEHFSLQVERVYYEAQDEEIFLIQF